MGHPVYGNDDILRTTPPTKVLNVVKDLYTYICIRILHYV